MVYLKDGEEITYTTDSGKDRKATIAMTGTIALGCVGVIPSDGSEQELIAADQIHGVELSDDGESWEIDGTA